MHGSIFTPHPHTHTQTLKHTPSVCTSSISSISSMSERERLVIALLPKGLMTLRKLNRSWWCDRAEGVRGWGGVAHRSPLSFSSFTTLQNSLLICCSVWGVWIVPASITIITRAVGTPSLGPSHWTAPAGRSLSPSPSLCVYLSLSLFLLSDGVGFPSWCVSCSSHPCSLMQTMWHCLNPTARCHHFTSSW